MPGNLNTSALATDSVQTRLKEDHHKLQKVTRERQIWLGEIATAEPSGKKLKATKATLDYAEWLQAKFLQLKLNEKKTKALPPRSVTVMNRWFSPQMVQAGLCYSPQEPTASRLAGPDRLPRLRPSCPHGLVRRPTEVLPCAGLRESVIGTNAWGVRFLVAPLPCLETFPQAQMAVFREAGRAHERLESAPFQP